MALSNIFREPRRELIETALGFAALGLFLVVDYWLACFLHWYLVDSTFLLVVGSLAMLFVLGLIHAVGEDIANSLARHGLELRPQRRF